MQDPATLINELRQTIRRHEYLYFVKNMHEISDYDFDQLMLRLKKLEEEHPELITPDSPTQRIGDAVASFNTVKHRQRMMSIDNSYSFADVADWVNRMEKLAGCSVFPIVAELKIDGVSGTFHYQHGRLQSGATRGNGIEGDQVTENVRTIRSLPLIIESDYDMDVRGEIYIKKSTLQQLNTERQNAGEEPFKNCRNLTSGTIKSLDPAVAAERNLQVMVYGIAQALELGFSSHSQALKFLEKQGFRLNHRFEVCNNLDEITGFIEKIAEERHSFDFDIDGIVLKVDKLSLHEELGATNKAPRWAIAYKYPQERAVSKLLQVEWQVGRSQLTPVAHLEPVEIGGTTVSRASLHNLDQINSKNIMLNDFVVVEKAGYIIPYIVEALKERRDGTQTLIQPPDNCPACGNALLIELDDGSEESSQVRCVNQFCVGVISRRIIHFATQLEIDNFGPQVIDRLLETGVIKKVEDVLDLEVAALEQIDRMGKKSAEKIVGNIKKASNAPLAKVISALGIANVGIVISESIAKEFKNSLPDFLAATAEKLVTIEGIQIKVAGNITDFISDPANEELLEKISSWWQGPSEEELALAGNSDALAGKTFVVTGAATVGRSKIEGLIKRHGGMVKASVNAKTDYLLIGSQEDENYVSGKKTKALQLQKPVINEYKLCEILGITIEEI